MSSLHILLHAQICVALSRVCTCIYTRTYNAFARVCICKYIHTYKHITCFNIYLSCMRAHRKQPWQGYVYVYVYVYPYNIFNICIYIIYSACMRITYYIYLHVLFVYTCRRQGHVQVDIHIYSCDIYTYIIHIIACIYVYTYTYQLVQNEFIRPRRCAIGPRVPVCASERWEPPVLHGHWRSCPMAPCQPLCTRSERLFDTALRRKLRTLTSLILFRWLVFEGMYSIVYFCPSVSCDLHII